MLLHIDIHLTQLTEKSIISPSHCRVIFVISQVAAFVVSLLLGSLLGSTSLFTYPVPTSQCLNFCGFIARGGIWSGKSFGFVLQSGLGFSTLSAFSYKLQNQFVNFHKNKPSGILIDISIDIIYTYL